VAIVGRPNVGKSSLLNAWSRCDRAIVTDLPGTTRDLVESQLVVAGIPIQVVDTAGIRATVDRVEQIGIERSRQAAQSADLVLLTIDGSVGWTQADETLYHLVSGSSTAGTTPPPVILVANKQDLITPHQPPLQLPGAIPVVYTAAAQNQGIEALETAILSTIKADQVRASNLEFTVNQRQAAALNTALLALRQVQQTILEQLPVDFWTIDLRLAIQALGAITGDDITESMLDEIFSRFCIGK
jgi:tRNA modification GTPase